jgi:EAL domain-containing protein (putative c-di-GMP-specific phosphodiesterase class I)
MTFAEADIPAFTVAFQPIVDASTGQIYSQEALVRGQNGESAQALFLSMHPDILEHADRLFRKKAISLAGQQGITSLINLNVMPSALERSADILMEAIDVAQECGLQAEQLLLEITESEIIIDVATFADSIDELRRAGLKFAIDDFGAGYAGLNLLADFQPDVVKLDMKLVRNIESRGPRQAIVRGIARTCIDLGIDIIAEGVETEDEFDWFVGEGITLFQGYLVARPSIGKVSTTFYLPERHCA